MQRPPGKPPLTAPHPILGAIIGMLWGKMPRTVALLLPHQVVLPLQRELLLSLRLRNPKEGLLDTRSWHAKRVSERRR
jgi:hypothetical protein